MFLGGYLMINEGRVCPRCGYERQSQDIAHDYECPRCGIVYAKYTRPEKQACAEKNNYVIEKTATPLTSAMDLAKTDDTMDETWPVPASLSRRALAAIYTNAKASLYSTFFLLLLLFQLFWSYRMKDASYVELDAIVFFIAVALQSLYAFLFRPIIKGATWGQEKFDMAVCPIVDSVKPLRWTHWTLRYLGNVVACLFWPITVAFFIYGVYARKNFPSFADRISMTQQYEAEKLSGPLKHHVFTAIKPQLIAALILFCVVFIPSVGIGIYDNYEKKAMAREAGESARFRNGVHERMDQYVEARENGGTLDILSTLEQRYYEDNGVYTEDLPLLLDRYDSESQQPTGMIRTLIKDGIVQAKITDQGIKLSVKTLSQGWESKVIQP
jgi:hypothetical protein